MKAFNLNTSVCISVVDPGAGPLIKLHLAAFSDHFYDLLLHDLGEHAFFAPLFLDPLSDST